jgi:hypothetical protein
MIRRVAPLFAIFALTPKHATKFRQPRNQGIDFAILAQAGDQTVRIDPGGSIAGSMGVRQDPSSGRRVRGRVYAAFYPGAAEGPLEG